MTRELAHAGRTQSVNEHFLLYKTKPTVLSAFEVLDSMGIDESWFVDAVWISLTKISIKLSSKDFEQRILNKLNKRRWSP